MKLGEAEIWLRQELATIYDEQEAGNIASLAMEELTHLSRSARALKKQEPLQAPQLHLLTAMHQRLMQNEPLQYVLGKAWFQNMPLYVDQHVLIPRPETEELVEWIVADVKASGLNVFEKAATEADETTKLKILDVGTGSGCIALALKSRMPKAEVWGCDVSDEALNVARRNGSELNIRVDFQGINFLDEAQQRSLPTVDIIVSNPPYIPVKDKETMYANVLKYEPHTALFVPDNNALIFYQALAAFGKKRLHPHGAVYMEIHEDLGHAVTNLFHQEDYQAVLKKDMQGKERMVKAWK